MRFALALLTLLLYLSPRNFRRAYGAAIRADFHDIFSEEYALHGFPGALRYAIRAYADVIASGLGERAAMIGRDTVYAIRSLRKTPFFTFVVIATLAIAIAANAAVFSIVEGVLLKPLPYTDPESLVVVNQTSADGRTLSFSYLNFADLRAQSRTFSDAAATVFDYATLSGRTKPIALIGQSVTFSYFDVFGVKPEIGRLLRAEDARSGAAHALVISDALYRSTFGGDPAILGSTVHLDGDAYRVVGVVPPAFRTPNGAGLAPIQYWSALRPSHEDGDDDRGQFYLSVYARLRPGVSIEAARADTNIIMANLARRYIHTNKHVDGVVNSLVETVIGPVRPLLLGVFAAVAGVLLVACANVANLLLSRAATRERELAVRYAIGASRARIIAQILTETLLFALLGGALGIALAAAAVREFIALAPPGIPRLDTVRFDSSAALFTFAAVVFCTLAAGIVPALALSRVQLGDALKAAGRGGDGTRGTRARAGFVVAEIAITLALVVASGLVVRSFVALTNTPLGFDSSGVLTMRVASLPEKRYRNDAQRVAFEHRAIERTAAIPGVTDAAWSASPPFGQTDYMISFDIPGKPLPVGDERGARFDIVSAGYFDVLRIPLVRGRLFEDGDRIGAPLVVIVSESFAKEFFGNASPIGKTIKPGITTEIAHGGWTIVGVCADIRTTYAQPPTPTMYFPNTQIALFENGTLLARTQPGVDRAALAATLPALDANFAESTVKPLDESLAANAARSRISAIALGTLAIIALFLAIAGIYAVVSYGVTQRTHEFGIRKALGARGSHVLADVLIRAARLAALGIVIGLIIAAFAARVVAAQLYGVSLADPLTYGVVILILFAAALCAALIPALRAMRVDPIVALRYE